jgi:DNA-binding IclR family transcriptional regulator
MQTTETATDSLSDADYAIAEAILDALSERCCRDYTRSQIARFVKVDTTHVERALAALVADGQVSSTDRGAWSRFKFIWG